MYLSYFRRDRQGGGDIHLDGGSLNLVLGPATRITLPNQSVLVADSGSALQTSDFDFSVDASNASMLHFGAGSSLALKLISATVVLNNDTRIALSSGRFNAAFRGDWSTNSPLTGQLDVSLLDATASGGQLRLNATTLIGIGEGSALKSSNLHFALGSFYGRGDFESANFIVKDKSQIGVPGGLQITTKANGTVVADTDPSSRLTLNGPNLPTGGVQIRTPFSRLVDRVSNPTFSVVDGTIAFKLNSFSDGHITGTDGAFTGTAVVENGSQYMTWSFNAHDLSLAKNSGDAVPQIKGRFNAKIIDGLNFNFTTDPVYHDPSAANRRIYPVSATIAQLGVVDIPDSIIEFGPGGVSFSADGGGPIKTRISFTLTVLPGRGEHQQPDDRDDTADGTHGPDQDQHWQEVFTDTYPCRVHLYLKPMSYSGTADVALSRDPTGIEIDVSNVKLDRDFEYDIDGCSIERAVVSVFIGDIGNKIQALAANYIQGFNKPFHIRV